ncbi:MAG TPA: LLM class flavin-dependent oxidoreductase [Candidatus Binataceae bacterium]|nr:LLM class flavin-dependent oxidoreductase [Candidatus Binataceae bacterium]
MAGCALSLSTFSRMPYPDFTRLAREAEDAGFSGVYVPEANNDAMLCAYSIAKATSRIKIGTRVINIHLRSPVVCGAGALMLQEESGGRFVLGLGVGHRALLKPLGIEMGNARDFLRHYMAILSPVLSGAPIASFPYQFRIAPEPIPIYFAALALGTARLAGELVNGLMLYMCPPPRMKTMIDAAREAAVKAGREPAGIGVTMGLPVFLDDDLKAAYDAARRDLATYLGLQFYNRVWAISGFEAEAKRGLEAANRGDRAQVAAALTDAMIDAVSLVGPASRCLARLDEYRRHGAITPVLVSHAVHGDYVSAVRENLKVFATVN